MLRTRLLFAGWRTIDCWLCCTYISAWGNTDQTKLLKESQLSAERLLIRSYLLAREFQPSERAFYLTRLLTVAPQVQPEFTKLWAEELFQLTHGLPISWNRLAMQKNALVGLAPYDPERALELFGQLDEPVPVASGGSILEDVRADGARTIFGNVWKQKGLSSLDSLRTAALRLSERGQYPYVAMIPVVKDLSERDSAIATSLFNEAAAAYKRGSKVVNADREFADFLISTHGLVSPIFAREALNAVVSHLLDKPIENEGSFRSKIFTDTGGAVAFNSRQDQLLFELIPLMKEIDPCSGWFFAEISGALGKADARGREGYPQFGGSS